MKNGKLPSQVLEKLISDIKTDSDVIQGPKIGMDGAKIRTKGKNFIIGGDPITFTCENMGEYCVYINANDIAVSGGIPKFLMSTILLPTDTEEEEAEKIFIQVKTACEKLSISLIGGHTEITDSVTRPIICGTMLGEEIYNFQPDKTPTGADVILINKPAIEGTSIIAFSGKEQLIKANIPITDIKKSENLSETFGICVLPIAKKLFSFDNIYYMHDPTEGGIASALWELSSAIGKGITVDNIEFMEETKTFCKVFGLDPMGLIASGSLLAVAEKGREITEYLKKDGYYAEVIGRVTGQEPKVYSKNEIMKTFQRDEIARFFEKLGENK